MYAKDVETSLRSENQRLQSELNDTKLDLDDARKSRRDFQAKLQEVESARDYYMQDAEICRVRRTSF